MAAETTAVVVVVVVAADSKPHQIEHETLNRLFKQLPHQGAACFRS